MDAVCKMSPKLQLEAYILNPGFSLKCKDEVRREKALMKSRYRLQLKRVVPRANVHTVMRALSAVSDSDAGMTLLPFRLPTTGGSVPLATEGRRQRHPDCRCSPGQDHLSAREREGENKSAIKARHEYDLKIIDEGFAIKGDIWPSSHAAAIP